MSTDLVLSSKFDRWIKRDEFSLTFSPDTPEAVFDEAFQALLRAHTRVQFYIGDAINFSQRYQYGRYRRFIGASGYSQQSLYNMSQIAASIPRERRRFDLPFAFYKAVAPFEPADQKRLLKNVVGQGWTVRELAAHIRSRKGDVVPRQYGEPMDFAGLRHAPINELGVVFLFGIVSKQLGFHVESIQIGFPDCSAKRLVDAKRKRWIHVGIEFEFTSRNFLEHAHPTTGCDLLVCWENDWLECPIEVIALRDEIDKLQRQSRKKA